MCCRPTLRVISISKSPPTKWLCLLGLAVGIENLVESVLIQQASLHPKGNEAQRMKCIHFVRLLWPLAMTAGYDHLLWPLDVRSGLWTFVPSSIVEASALCTVMWYGVEYLDMLVLFWYMGSNGAPYTAAQPFNDLAFQWDSRFWQRRCDST